MSHFLILQIHVTRHWRRWRHRCQCRRHHVLCSSDDITRCGVVAAQSTGPNTPFTLKIAGEHGSPHELGVCNQTLWRSRWGVDGVLIGVICSPHLVLPLAAGQSAMKADFLSTVIFTRGALNRCETVAVEKGPSNWVEVKGGPSRHVHSSPSNCVSLHLPHNSRSECTKRVAPSTLRSTKLS